MTITQLLWCLVPGSAASIASYCSYGVRGKGLTGGNLLRNMNQ
ncbi:gp112 [Erwinia phage vB_EamP-S6]|uniref:Gp112 n=1 Tax=Erwinia phage vB_EamP-S6 TaxID=1051675 RepID=G0YQK4_9CAUD|nr:gp112 [Erwinia phage vB_EamP-S6]AEJ81631.1 gp112 [Erwinia phage vB_EamP-S6]